LGRGDAGEGDLFALFNEGVMPGAEMIVSLLEKAYAEESLGEQVSLRMKSDADFARAVKGVLTNPAYQARLGAAIESSPYMGEQIAQRKQELEQVGSQDFVQQTLQDEALQQQIEELVRDPSSLQRVQNQSEEKLKECGDALARGVAEYRDEFEPGADDLMRKFQDIASEGYPAFVKYAASDERVKNAMINALLDAMEEDRANTRT